MSWMSCNHSRKNQDAAAKKKYEAQEGSFDVSDVCARKCTTIQDYSICLISLPFNMVLLEMMSHRKKNAFWT